jgi:ribonuclease-3
MNLEDIIGIKFNDRALLEQALVHRSLLNESANRNLVSNERLEFLGDAILSLIASEFLYKEFPKSSEGDLTNLRASLVRTQTLALVAKKINLTDHLKLSKGEEEQGGRENTGILADCFEAVLGAIYLDQGLLVTRDFISRTLFPLLKEIITNGYFKDFKSHLQETIQAKEKISPSYRVIKSLGPDHDRIFTVGVYLRRKKLGQGSGHSKHEAQQQAAQNALAKIGSLK